MFQLIYVLRATHFNGQVGELSPTKIDDSVKKRDAGTKDISRIEEYASDGFSRMSCHCLIQFLTYPFRDETQKFDSYSHTRR